MKAMIKALFLGTCALSTTGCFADKSDSFIFTADLPPSFAYYAVAKYAPAKGETCTVTLMTIHTSVSTESGEQHTNQNLKYRFTAQSKAADWPSIKLTWKSMPLMELTMETSAEIQPQSLSGRN